VARYKLEECRQRAADRLDDAADWLRYIAEAPATARQLRLIDEALTLIGQAKALLDEAAGSR
jgi:hypothetical protein